MGNDSGHRGCNRGSFNLDAHFIAPNPATSFNPCSEAPTLASSAYVGSFSCVIGDVRIGEDVYIAPLVSIRADEGSPFHIGAHTNVQDGVILHGLKHGRVTHDGRLYSIYIGDHVSCAHGCIIHGPCKIEDNVFVGFRAVVLNAIIGEGCYISIGSLVTGGIRLASNRFVPPGAIIDTQEKADALGRVSESDHEFADEVLEVNAEFPRAYARLFGKTRCSCGLACCGSVMDVLE